MSADPVQPTRPVYVVGVDLGQVNDPTAIAILEASGRGLEARFEVQHFWRPLGKPYTYIADRVRAIVEKLAKKGEPIVGFDQTGVGRAVADILRAAEIPAPLYGITITAGDSVTRGGNEFHVPKRDLVAALQVAFQNGKIKIARRLSLTELFTRELLNFRVKVTSAGSEVFEAWRSGQHDDTVLAVAIAVWIYRQTRAREFDLVRWAELEMKARAAAAAAGPIAGPPEPNTSKMVTWPPPGTTII